MEEIIGEVERKAIISELKEEHFLRNTTKGGNQLYLVNYHNAPNITREVGRLREVAFRTAGGGTGKKIDLDDYDLSEHAYDQLIVWDPEDQEIMAGYRLLKCRLGERDEEGNLKSATSKLFNLSPRMIDEFLPLTLELGRSFVQPKYQRTAPRKGIFALDNLWDGLATVMLMDPQLKYLFGKVTMYPKYHREARNIILAFMRFFFPDPDELVRPRVPLVQEEELSPYYSLFKGLGYKEAHKILNAEVKKRGENIPPLINSYMSLSSTMRSFGTAENGNFGTVEETGILITFDDIEPARKERYIKSFEENKQFKGPLHVPTTEQPS
tara:strand:+ start:2067 stop:3041 length:975 start_codon:yes stop_codon:yes gene_type:complete